MKIEEAIHKLISHSVCIKNNATCSKQCAACPVYVPAKEMDMAIDMALDALYICKATERYRIQIDKAS